MHRTVLEDLPVQARRRVVDARVHPVAAVATAFFSVGVVSVRRRYLLDRHEVRGAHLHGSRALVGFTDG